VFEHDSTENDDRGPDTLRLWLSEQQWLSILSRIESQTADYQGPERRHPRQPVTLRCVVRVQQPDGRSATYLLRSRNISKGGLGFVHSAPIAPSTRCTVALQAIDGFGLIASGRIAWCRDLNDLDTHAHEVGLQFDRPIDISPFIDDPAPAV
jgi:hypothetical protein